jgi:hypothetical protein
MSVICARCSRVLRLSSIQADEINREAEEEHKEISSAEECDGVRGARQRPAIVRSSARVFGRDERRKLFQFPPDFCGSRATSINEEPA